MNLHWTLPAVAALLLTASLAPTLNAQAFYGNSNSTVSGTGMEVIKRQPGFLRLQIELSAKAATLGEALKKLNARRDAALEQLAKMSSEKETIEAGAPHIDTAGNDRQRQIEMMVQQRLRQRSKKSKKPDKKPVTVALSLKAEWTLKGATADEILLEAHQIEEKVRAADLSGKDSEESTAEDEELTEEMADQISMYENANQPKPGEPYFIYVSKISPEERAKAMAAAFAKARQQAEQLSQAAGAELGPLSGLSATATNPFNYGYNSPFAGTNQFLTQLMSQQNEQGANDMAEAVGAQPGQVVLPINVMASFQLGASK
ncbi:MAG: SIMPL domain-containing protein [Pirellulales bacterium]